jgi:Flp pilus assembly pilin Flp
MPRLFRNRKGQNTAEYAILIGLVVAVAVAMQTYVKRGLQGRVHDEVAAMVTGTSGLGSTNQYEPYYMNSQYNTFSNAYDNLSKTAKNPERDVYQNVSQNGVQNLFAPNN